MYTKKIVSPITIAGAFLGICIFLLGFQNSELINSQSYVWGITGFSIMGGFISWYGNSLFQKINLSSSFYTSILALIFCLLILMLLATGQSWYLQNRDYNMLGQLQEIETAIGRATAQYNSDRNSEAALLALKQNQRLLEVIQSRLVLAATMQRVNNIEIKMISFKNLVQSKVVAKEEIQNENWHERVFVRSATPFFLDTHVKTASPLILKNPVKSRPYNNDLLAIIFDGHIRND